jgi:hexosaminidase
LRPDGVTLSAANPLGVDARPADFSATGAITPRGFTVPCGDHRRQAALSLARPHDRLRPPLHSAPVIERNLDAMEAVKLNVFHWHLSEDQGFRVESKVFPLLAAEGLGRPVLHAGADPAHRSNMRAIAASASFRSSTCPRMPRHGSPAIRNCASGKGPYEIERHWGVFDPAMDPTRESTYQFLNLLIGEMTALFPDLYFHIGGDECNGKEWDANPRIQEFMQAPTSRTTRAAGLVYRAGAEARRQPPQGDGRLG